MKILYIIPNNNQRYYTILGYINILSAHQHQCIAWKKENKPTFDIFDEYEPDIFISFVNDIDTAILKCLEERPFVRTIFIGDNWEKTNQISKELTIKINPEIFISDIKVNEITNFIQHQPRLDTIIYNTHDISSSAYISDICCIELFQDFTNEQLQFLINLCKRRDLNIKIFHHKKLDIPQWIGTIEYVHIKYLLNSTKIALILNPSDISIQANYAICHHVPNIDINDEDIENMLSFTPKKNHTQKDTYQDLILTIFNNLGIENEIRNSS